MRRLLLFCTVTVLALAATTPAATTWYYDSGTPYLQFSNSPFSGLTFNTFYLEDFEDQLLNTPGVSVDRGYITSSTYSSIYVDSVDIDGDGAIDGSGNAGESWFYGTGSTGITFTFNPLPTHVGIVWTDGSGTTRFEAFDSGGISLGTIGPVSIADGVYTGTTAEDRFFGVSNPDGIWKIKISNTSAGIEVDHLQYGVIPAPGAILLCSIGAGFVGCLRRRKTI